MVTEFNKIFMGHQVVEHCSTTWYGYVPSKHSILYSENNVCYAQASHNLAKTKVVFGSKLN